MGMDEIIPNLWIGDITSAQNVETLRNNGIYSVLSAMRGRVRINETFTKHQILMDDTTSTDALIHFLPSIAFIQAELEEKKRGVLVHCQAGMSRSATIVAAYIMFTRNISPDEALAMIREKRPVIDPNPGFLLQLEIFHNAQYEINRKDKSTRMFYMDRAVEEMMNGDGTLEEGTLGMLAHFPPTPPAAVTPTTSDVTTNPFNTLPTRPTPKRRIRCKMCRQELATREHMLDHGQLGPPTRKNSVAASRKPSFAMSPALEDGLGSRRPSMAIRRPVNLLSGFGMTDSRRGSTASGLNRPAPAVSSSLTSESSALDSDEEEVEIETDRARFLGRRMSDAISGLRSPAGQPEEIITTIDANQPTVTSPTTLSRTPSAPPSRSNSFFNLFTSPPIITNPKCSGYFVEPMDWMQAELQTGALAGKITCPNTKCGAKLGNYDWAGVCCGCKQWVVPGFCIARAKVDEIV